MLPSIRNDLSRLFAIFTEITFPIIAQRDENKSRAEDAEFDLSKTSFEKLIAT
jgi:hypothetical protein